MNPIHDTPQDEIYRLRVRVKELEAGIVSPRSAVEMKRDFVRQIDREAERAEAAERWADKYRKWHEDQLAATKKAEARIVSMLKALGADGAMSVLDPVATVAVVHAELLRFQARVKELEAALDTVLSRCESPGRQIDSRTFSRERALLERKKGGD
jgi:hypothetical protein